MGSRNSISGFHSIQFVYRIRHRRIHRMRRWNYFSSPSTSGGVIIRKLDPGNTIYTKHWNVPSITPVRYNVCPRSWWKMPTCVGSALCWSEKFCKFLTSKPQPNVRYPAHNMQEKVFIYYLFLLPINLFISGSQAHRKHKSTHTHTHTHTHIYKHTLTHTYKIKKTITHKTLNIKKNI